MLELPRAPASRARRRRGTGTTTSLAREDEGASAAKLPPSRAAAAAAEEDPAPKHPPRPRRARRRDGASARLLPAPISHALFPPPSSPSERKRERMLRWGTGADGNPSNKAPIELRYVHPQIFTPLR